VFLFASAPILLQVLGSEGASALKVVKWHPTQPGVLAVASEREIHLLDVNEASRMFGGEAILLSDLHRVSKVFSIPSVSQRFCPNFTLLLDC